MTPHEALTRALIDLADARRRTPCQLDPDPFTSDDYQTRADAAPRCHPCPVRTACDTAGDGEAHGIWGGTDRTPTTRGKRNP